MGYAEQILKEILTEEARQTDVINAIRKKKECEITYRADNEPKGTGKRLIQPVAFGKSKSGNLVVRAYEPFGDTKTEVERWKLFRLDRIESWKTLWNRSTFKEPPSTHGKFNDSGKDNSMSETYVVADFLNKKMRNNALMDYNKKRHQEKLDNNPLYDLQRNVQKRALNTNFDYDTIMKNVQDWHKQHSSSTNFDSARNMASIKDFGDSQVAQTSGPITKSTTQDVNNNGNITKPNYSSVVKNSPVYKNNIQQQGDEQNKNEKEEEIDNNEGNAIQ